MAKSEKQAKKAAPAADASTGEGETRRLGILFTVAVIAAAVAGGLYWRSHSSETGGGPKTDPDLAELMAPGPLPEMALGNADAPNTIIEYASMTCPHCAQFEKIVFPDLKTKYVDTGKVRFIFREFPLDGLAARASMLARCAGPDRYFPILDGLFQTQANWVVQGDEGMDKLLQFARQAGFSKESFDKCMDDKELFNKIVETRRIGHEKFGVDSTPSFFINGKRLSGEHELKDFEAMFIGASQPQTGANKAPEGNATPMPEGSTSQPEGTPGQ